MFIPKHYSGYSICLRPAGAVPDADLLARLGLTGWLPTEFRPRRQYLVPMVALAEVGDWTVVADGLTYTLSNRPDTRKRLVALAGDVGELFVGYTADCWDTFGFSYYRGGRLVRDYLADPEAGQPERVMTSVGEPLPGEARTPERFSAWEPLYGVAAALGIGGGVAVTNTRVYHQPPAKPGDPSWFGPGD